MAWVFKVNRTMLKLCRLIHSLGPAHRSAPTYPLISLFKQYCFTLNRINCSHFCWASGYTLDYVRILLHHLTLTCVWLQAMEEIPVGSIDGGGASKSGGSFSDKCDAILKDARQYIKSKLGIPYDFVIHTMLVVENKLVKCTSRFDTIVCQLVHMKYCWTKKFLVLFSCVWLVGL